MKFYSQYNIKIFEGKKVTIIYVALIIAVALAVYSNCLYNQFVCDDEGLVELNSYIKSWSSLPKIFASGMGAGYTGESSVIQLIFYRPLQSVTYMIDYSLWKLQSGGYHITNILLHILAALSVYFFISIIYGDRLVSFFTSILFIICPLNAEVVNYISGRADSLSLFFLLLTFIFYLKQMNSGRATLFIPMLLMYILALLSKENSLILPALLAAYHYFFKKKVMLPQFICLLCLGLLYAVFRITFLRHSTSIELDFTGISQRLTGFFAAITNYIRLLLFPFNLHFDYGRNIFTFADSKAITGLTVTILLLVYAIREKVRDVFVSFSIFWFFLALLPVSNIFYLLPFYMAEHYLYVPAIAFFLLLARGFASLYRSNKNTVLLKIFILSFFISYASMTVYQNNFWIDSVTLYKRALQYTPNSSLANNDLGREYLKKGDNAAAINSFKRCIVVSDANIQKQYANLAAAYIKNGEYEKAIRCYKNALKIDSSFSEAYTQIAVLTKK